MYNDNNAQILAYAGHYLQFQSSTVLTLMSVSQLAFVGQCDTNIALAPISVPQCTVARN